MTLPRHLVTVWNPAYADDAMGRHLELLLDRARRARAGELEADDVGVWWGKVRSPNRLSAPRHAEDLRALDRQLEEDDEAEALEVQLYLTDYRSLYVADVVEIREGALEAGERDAVPAYYGRQALHCDAWFRLADIRLLVADDLEQVVAELRRLHNVHYHDKPVSIYGGMVDLPLVVTRPDGQRFFDRAERDAVTDGRLWAEWDAEQGSGVARLERELRDNLLGARAWDALEPAARRFLASGEKLFRDHRDDAAFDFAPALVSFAKALEVQSRAVLRHALARAPESARRANVEGRTVDVTRAALTLGQLARVLVTEAALRKGLDDALRDRGWFTGSLPPILDEFVAVRNAAAHDRRVDRATAAQWRDRILGVGCEGIAVALARPLATP